MIRLDLADIQGNIHRPYGRFGFPYSRHLFFHIADPAAGRRFVQGIRPRVTTAESWDERGPDGTLLRRKPPITLNIGFTYPGLRALDLPTRTLRLLPDEFIDGMGCRSDILGDVQGSAPDQWDPVWRAHLDDGALPVHVWVSLNVGASPDGSPLPVLAEWTRWLEGLAAPPAAGVTLLSGHGKDGSGRWQDSAARMGGPEGAKVPLPKEPFGFTDGIGDPVFRGQLDEKAEALAAVGGGKIAEGPYDPATSWSALEAGEFILGQVDEGQEFPVATQPPGFARNGTFMVWRKLRQDTKAFDAEMLRQADLWKKVTGITCDREAYETVCAKLVGRWRSGIPLLAAPSWADHERLSKNMPSGVDLARILTGFRYGDDLDGSKCPFGAHIRRANPRDMLDPELSVEQGATTLTNRRRILRRGLPYADPDGEVGVIMMAICASVFRQFEFIQQQWMSYGLDFEAGNDSCPLTGNRAQSDKHVIPGGPANETTFIAAGLPEFVATRGGDYFFLPSLNAIRMIAMGTVDPT
ncbi:Dyp-type peroxidase [Mesorhizobium sp. URHB0026]